MNWILLWTFGATCLLLIWAPLRERAGFLHFPLLAGGGALGFIFVQAVGTLQNSTLVPEEGLSKALVMCTLCNLAIFFAWCHPTPIHWRSPSRWEYPLNKLYWTGILFLAVGAVGEIKLLTLAGGVTRSLSVDSEITRWEGLPVAYLFIAMLVRPGQVMVGLSALKMRAPWRILPAVPFLLLEAGTIILAARRGPLIDLTLAMLCVVYFAKHIIPSKLWLAGFTAIAIAAMFIFPLIRGYTQIGGDRDKLREVSLSKTSRDLLSGEEEQCKEFIAAVYIIQTTEADSLYMFGGRFYNTFIRLFVPKLLVGAELKSDLLLQIPDPERQNDNSYHWVKQFYVAPTGPASAFIDFGYLGAGLYWFLTRGLKFLWVRAAIVKDPLSELLYTLTLGIAMTAVVADFAGGLLAPALQCFILPWASLLVIRRPKCSPARRLQPAGRQVSVPAATY